MVRDVPGTGVGRTSRCFLLLLWPAPMLDRAVACAHATVVVAFAPTIKYHSEVVKWLGSCCRLVHYSFAEILWMLHKWLH